MPLRLLQNIRVDQIPQFDIRHSSFFGFAILIFKTNFLPMGKTK